MSDRYRIISATLDDPKNLACVVRELVRREVTVVHFDGELSWEVIARPSLIRRYPDETQERPWDEDDEKEYPMKVTATTSTHSSARPLSFPDLSDYNNTASVRGRRSGDLHGTVVGTVRDFLNSKIDKSR